jgi:hypothetical protein
MTPKTYKILCMMMFQCMAFITICVVIFFPHVSERIGVIACCGFVTGAVGLLILRPPSSSKG